MKNGTDNQKVLGNCPSCQRLMQIPVVTNVASVAKCPHCHNEIPVRDLLSSAVPEAEIINKDQDKDKHRVSDYIADRQRVYDDKRPKVREKFDVPNQIYNGASRRTKNKKRGFKSNGVPATPRGESRRNRSSGTSRSDFSNRSPDLPSKDRTSNGRTSSAAANTKTNGSSSTTQSSIRTAKETPANGSANAGNVSAAPSVPRERRSPTPRPVASPAARRRSSEEDDETEFGIGDVVKFLFGGLIAAPLAYLALLWVLGVDPFGMASTFESISPAIIPDSLRSEIEQPASGFTMPAADDSSEDLFGISADEDEELPLPSLDPDMVR